MYLVDVANGDRWKVDVGEWGGGGVDGGDDGGLGELGDLHEDKGAGHHHRGDRHQEPRHAPPRVPALVDVLPPVQAGHRAQASNIRHNNW